MRTATVCGLTGSGVAHADDSEGHGLVAETVESRAIEIGLCRLD